jgi:hypothetical protein
MVRNKPHMQNAFSIMQQEMKYLVLTIMSTAALAACCTEEGTVLLEGHWNTSSQLASNSSSCSKLGELVCPPGLFCNEGHCMCGDSYPYNIINCNGTDSFVLKYYCAMFDEDKNLTSVGSCFIPVKWSVMGHYPGDTLYSIIPRNASELSEHTCKPLNRVGTLCGRCLPGYYPSAYSYNMTCVNCPNVRWNWVQYIIAAYLPLTLFCIIILFFKINVTSSQLFPVVYYCQQLSQPYVLRVVFSVLVNSTNSNLYFVTKIFASLYGVWNLDFFRPFYSDLSLRMGILPTLALDYAIAVYPLLLMTISYLLIVLYDRNYRVVTIMWRPFQVLFSLFRRNWDIRTSLIDAFATFLFLSNMKLLSTSFDLLIPTQVYELYPHHSNSAAHLYYSGDIEYFSSEHLPYAILALTVVCAFVLLPIAVLILYPFRLMQKFMNTFPSSLHFLHTFVDSFQGCFKNGTQPGTRDCRWFASMHLIVRLSFFLIYSLTDKLTFLTMSVMILVLHTTSVAVLQPFKSSVTHYNWVITLLLLTLLAVTVIGLTFALLTSPHLITFFSIVGIIIYAIPFLYTIGVTTYWVYVHRRFGLNIVLRLRSWRNGYTEVDTRNDDNHIPDRIENSFKYPKENLARFPS